MITTDPIGLQTWLTTARDALIVDAYTLVAKNGTVARWISGDFDFTLPAPDNRTFVRGPIIERDQLAQSIGLSVDPLNLVFKRLRSDDPQVPTVMFGAISLVTAASAGVLRGATVSMERLVFDVAATPLTLTGSYKGRWQEFAGTLEIKNFYNGTIKAEVIAETALLDTMMPRDLYQPMCRNQVFDAQCGLSRATFTVSGSVTGVTADPLGVTVINTGLTQANNYFDGGVIRFTSGPNAGVWRTVKTHLNASGQVIVAAAWPFAPVNGNTFTIEPGCARNTNTCTTKFNNLARYRGEPYIPAPETVT